jgi:hypothetical protein
MTRLCILAGVVSLLALGGTTRALAQATMDQPGPIGPSGGFDPSAPMEQPAPPTPTPPDPRYCPPPADRSEAYPRQAHPGQCFAKVYRPPVYQTVTEEVEVTPARRQWRTVPAVYEWADRREVVAPEHVERHVIPATYRTVTETVVVRPATVREDFIPPRYETVTERVVVSPAHTEWRQRFVGPEGVIPADARVEPTGEIVCLVEVPAQYADRPEQVLVQPARAIEVPIPAETQTVERRVIDRPEQVVETLVPAVYRTVHYQRLVTPEHREVVEIPAVHAAREHRRLVSPGAWEWREVICARPR